MAVTSIWRIKGHLGKVITYVENPEKTEASSYDEEIPQAPAQDLSDVIQYAVNSSKTTQYETGVNLKRFVSGINCNPGTAREEMIAVKQRFGKEDGTIAYHGYQSFAPGEATPEIAHEIGIKLAQQLWGDRYQVVVATHLDKEHHLHNHFVVNTVSFVDGIKYHRTGKDYHDMQSLSDELCREYSLSVIIDPKSGQSKHYGEWRAEQEGRPTWRSLIRSDVDEAIQQSMTERQFFDTLRRKGYEIKIGKDISIRPPRKERFVRLARNFGPEYTIEGIRQRILHQQRPRPPLPEPKTKPSKSRMVGSYKAAKKVTGFRALYFHYCYLLGYFPKQKQTNRKRIHFLLREDLIKLDAISQEARLLAEHRIDTAEQLSFYTQSLEGQIDSLTQQRKSLYRKLRLVDIKSDAAQCEAIRESISVLTNELKYKRREVKLCNNIAVRSGIMLEKIKTVHNEQIQQRKEMTQDEQFRRRGRTDR